MSLLRALAAPRTATHRAALRYSTAASTPAPAPSPASPTPPTPTPTTTTPSKAKALKTARTVPFTPATQPSLPLSPPRYHVARSAFKNLPIYSDYKRGGNLHLTTVRKITGDQHALRDELRAWLGKKDADVTVNALTGHVVVKGHHTAQVAEFLKARGM